MAKTHLSVDTNYGLIGNPPPGKSIPPFIDAMGPWPRRAVIVMGLAVIRFVLTLLPWRMTSQRVELEGDSLEAGECRA
jgi:uncharacterized membrane protein YwaF